MKEHKWAITRWVLRSLAAGIGAAASASPPGVVTVVLVGLAAGIGMLSIDMPRDKWPPEKKE